MQFPPRHGVSVWISLFLFFGLTFELYGFAAPGDYRPSGAYDSKNRRYLVVYEKFDLPSGDFEIYGRIFLPEGIPYGPEIRITDYPDKGQQAPVVAYDDVNGRFLVVWPDYRLAPEFAPNFSYLYGQWVGADGSLEGSNFRISPSPSMQTNPAVAFDGNNQRFLVVWEDYRNNGSYIFGRLLRSGGNFIGGEFPLHPSGFTGDLLQGAPVLAYVPSLQKYLAVWDEGPFLSFMGFEYPRDIYGKLLDGDGNPEENSFKISTGTGDSRMPAIALDTVEPGRFLAAWRNSTAIDDYNYFVLARVMEANGTPVTADPVTLGSTTYTLPLPVIIKAAFDRRSPGYLAVWDNAEYKIKGQRLTSGGDLQGSEMIIAEGLDRFYRTPALIYNPWCSNFLAAFEGHAVLELQTIGSPSCSRAFVPLLLNSDQPFQ